MAKKKAETIDTNKEITNENLLSALEIMDKKINIICNVMLELEKYLDDKKQGKLSVKIN